jgi:hypothetical protein
MSFSSGLLTLFCYFFMAAVIESLVNRILECEGNAEQENERFIAVKDSETHDIVQSERNANTIRATSSHLRLFKNWRQSV